MFFIVCRQSTSGAKKNPKKGQLASGPSHFYLTGVASAILSVTIFIFLPASTGTRIVSSHLLLHADRFQLSLLRLSGSSVGSGSPTHFILLGAVFAVIGLLIGCSLADTLRILYRYLPTHQDRHGFCIDLVNHHLEEVERFELVDQQRILLFVAGVLNRMAKFIHLPEMLLPVFVDGV